MIEPLANNAKDGYVKQKQQEARDRAKANVEIVVDEKQAEKEIDRAMEYIVKKLSK